MKKYCLLQGLAENVLKDIPDNVFHTAVTSPPYWQLREYFVDGQLGRESTPEEYVENLVAILREVKRVLRKDGTLWLNIGDSYNNNSGYSRSKDIWKRQGREGGSADRKFFKHDRIKQKDLVGIPWMVAFALQKDGWFLRCDLIWEKTNPMPDGAKDRPTRSHEYVFLLSKSSKYFYDYYRILEDTDEKPEGKQGFGANVQKGTFRCDQDREFEHYGKKNKRSVWKTSVASFKGGHYATFPTDLIEPMIMASTSEYGCCAKCGTPWNRKFGKRREKILIKKTDMVISDSGEMIKAPDEYKEELVLFHDKWEKGCSCDTNEVNPCIVLDPFSGTSTTGDVSFKYNQYYVGIEPNPEYIEMAKTRLNPTGSKDMEICEISSIKDFYERI